MVKYVVFGGIPAFWIDQECIDQKDEKAKFIAMQSMDVIYRRSLYPVGMLSTPVQCQEEIHSLLELLNDDLIVRQSLSQGPRLAAEVDICESPRHIRCHL